MPTKLTTWGIYNVYEWISFRCTGHPIHFCTWNTYHRIIIIFPFLQRMLFSKSATTFESQRQKLNSLDKRSTINSWRFIFRHNLDPFRFLIESLFSRSVCLSMHTEKIRLTIYGDCSQGKENIFQVFLLEINLSSLNESQLKVLSTNMLLLWQY